MRKKTWLGSVGTLLIAGWLSACNTVPTGALAEPIVHLSDLRLRDVGVFEQHYTIKLRVENPNPFELPINGMSYQVLLNKVELGRGTSRQTVTIPPFGEHIVEVDLSSNMFSLMQRVQEIASGAASGVRVSITGNMNLVNRAQPLPFSFHGDLGTRGSSS